MKFISSSGSLFLSMLPSLLYPEEMPEIAGIKIPSSFYVVLSEPAFLAGMALPGRYTPWENIGSAGFSHVVCLSHSKVYYNPYPLNVLFSAELEDLCHGYGPENPVREEQLIRQAVDAIRKKIDDGEGVVVHCVGGTGRTGTVLGCVLRDLGFQAAEVINYLDDLNKERGRSGWPEAEWQGKMIRRY